MEEVQKGVQKGEPGFVYTPKEIMTMAVFGYLILIGIVFFTILLLRFLLSFTFD